MKDFLFIYEHVNREIENDILVIYELEKRGYKCKLISFFGPDYVLRRLFNIKSKVVITPWLRYDANLYDFMKLADKNHKIVNLQYEQVETLYIENGKLMELACRQAYHFCWGLRRQKLLNKKGIDISLLPVVGALQQDFARKRFDKYYKSKKVIAKEFNYDINKKWVLFISSFSTVSWSSQAIREYGKEHSIDYNEIIELEKKSQKVIVEWICKFMNEKKDIEFIYRPHPSETNNSLLVEMKKKFSNFHINTFYSVKQWGKVCEKTCLWMSTSNAELFSMKIPYIVLRPIEIPINYDIVSFIGDRTVRTYEEFKDIIEGGEYLINEEKKVRKELIEENYSFEDEPAYVRYADELENILYSPNSNLNVNRNEKRKSKINFAKDCIKSVIYCIDIIIPQIKVIERLPLSDDSKNLLRTRSFNYRNMKFVKKNIINYLKNNRI